MRPGRARSARGGERCGASENPAKVCARGAELGASDLAKAQLFDDLLDGGRWPALERVQAESGEDESVRRRTLITVAQIRAAGTRRAAPTLLPLNNPIVLKFDAQVEPESLNASISALRVASVWQA